MPGPALCLPSPFLPSSLLSFPSRFSRSCRKRAPCLPFGPHKARTGSSSAETPEPIMLLKPLKNVFNYNSHGLGSNSFKVWLSRPMAAARAISQAGTEKETGWQQREGHRIFINTWPWKHVIIKITLHTCKQKDKRCIIAPHVVPAGCLWISHIGAYSLIYIHKHINFRFFESEILDSFTY